MAIVTLTAKVAIAGWSKFRLVPRAIQSIPKSVAAKVATATRSKATLSTVSGTTPSLPANLLVGQPSYRAISWGGGNFVFESTSLFNTREGWGFFGAAVGGGLAQYAVDAINGSGQLISEVPNTAGSAYDWQRAQEGRGVASINGGTTNLGAFKYRVTDPNFETYLKFYLAPASHPSTYPAMFDWWNDAQWVTAAAWFGLLARDLKNNLGGSGCGFDPEPGSWTALASGRTRAEQDQKAHDRAYQCGQAFFGDFPNGKVFVYQFTHPGCYGDILDYYELGDTRPKAATKQGSWMLGFLKAMCDFGGPNSRFMAMDSPFYTWGEGGAGGPSVDSRSGKLKLNCERSMACLSQPYPLGVGATSWSKGCDRIQFIPAAWPGPSAGGRATPNSTLPSEWATQELVDREWSMGQWRCVYHGPEDAAAGGNDGTPSGLWYNTPTPGGTVYGHGTTHLAGNQAAANSAALTTKVLPTCTNLSWTGSTLSCRAAHLHGVTHVKVYNGSGFNPANPEPSYLGAMTMDWGHPSLPDYVGTPAKVGGNASAAYPTATRVADSYQDCTFTRAGSAGAWLVLKVVSSKFDVAWFRVQHS